LFAENANDDEGSGATTGLEFQHMEQLAHGMNGLRLGFDTRVQSLGDLSGLNGTKRESLAVAIVDVRREQANTMLNCKLRVLVNIYTTE
jgi:hypothetical protein